MTELKLVTLMQWFMMGFPPDLSEKNTEFYIIFRKERLPTDDIGRMLILKS